MFKRVLFTIIGAFAALSVGAAGAYFAAQVQVADSVIRAGSVAISTVPTTAPLAIDALAPGTIGRSVSGGRQRRVAAFRPGGDVVQEGAASRSSTMRWRRVSRARDTEVYSGPLSALRTTPLRLAPGAQGDLRFEISLPATATNAVASDYAQGLALRGRRAGTLVRSATGQPRRVRVSRSAWCAAVALALRCRSGSRCALPASR